MGVERERGCHRYCNASLDFHTGCVQTNRGPRNRSSHTGP
jgi:hypothetical protein